jgi:hypothetical protein
MDDAPAPPRVAWAPPLPPFPLAPPDEGACEQPARARPATIANSSEMRRPNGRCIYAPGTTSSYLTVTDTVGPTSPNGFTAYTLNVFGPSLSE